MSPAEVVAELLRDNSIGTDPTASPVGLWPVYVDNFPDKPNQVLCVYDTTPIIEGRLMRSGLTVEHPGIQVAIRASDHRTGWDKAVVITTLFDSVLRQSVTLDGVGFLIQAIHHNGIIRLGQEEDTRRNRFTINAVLTIEQVS